MAELARSTRSGVVEARHDGAAVAVRADGSIAASWGDPHVTSFYRSAIKPFQATASQRNGADLVPEQMVLACASHSGQPVHIALVENMLEGMGLEEDDLGCPSALPGVVREQLRRARAGGTRARPAFHNCSGKHAAFLRASRASGFPLDSYLAPDHPHQKNVLTLVAEATGERPREVGVDGCGAPTPAGTLRGLALAFARLTVDPEFRDASTAMTRYPSLVSSNLNGDAAVAAWFGGPVKRGAMGIIAAGRHGLGMAVKSRDGSARVALIGLISVMRSFGMLSDVALGALEDVAAPPVFGGGRRVGTVEPALGT